MSWCRTYRMSYRQRRSSTGLGPGGRFDQGDSSGSISFSWALLRNNRPVTTTPPARTPFTISNAPRSLMLHRPCRMGHLPFIGQPRNFGNMIAP